MEVPNISPLSQIADRSLDFYHGPHNHDNVEVYNRYHLDIILLYLYRLGCTREMVICDRVISAAVVSRHLSWRSLNPELCDRVMRCIFELCASAQLGSINMIELCASAQLGEFMKIWTHYELCASRQLGQLGRL